MTLFDLANEPQTPQEAISDASLGRNKSKYPVAVAKGKTSTSAKVAREKDKEFKSIQAQVLQLYMSGFIGSADDCAKRLKMDIVQIRPRTTGLKKLGLLVVESVIGQSKFKNDAEVLRYRSV